MSVDNVAIAEAYYTAVGKKDFANIEKYLHPDVQFKGPVSQYMGKKELLEGTKKFTSFFNALKIRAKFGAGDQAVIVYDVDFPLPIGHCPSAALMTFEKGLITKIELFFDGSPFTSPS